MRKKLGIITLSAFLSISTVQAASAVDLWSEDLWKDDQKSLEIYYYHETPYTDLWSEGLWEDHSNTTPINNHQNNQSSPYTDLWSEDLWKDTDTTNHDYKENTKQDLWTNPTYVELWSEPEYVEIWSDVVTTDQWANLVRTPQWSKAMETGQWMDVVKTKEWEALQQTQSWKSLIDAQSSSWIDSSVLEMPPGEVSFDTPPLEEGGRTFVPIRTILDLTGAEVDWNNAKQTVTVKKGNITIVLTIGFKTALVNNKKVSLDAPAKIKDGRTLVPLRFLSEQLGYKVDYDTKARKVTIDNKWYFSTDPATYQNKKSNSKTNTSNSKSNDLIYGGLNDAQWNAMKIFEKYGASGGFGLNYWGQSGF